MYKYILLLNTHTLTLAQKPTCIITPSTKRTIPKFHSPRCPITDSDSHSEETRTVVQFHNYTFLCIIKHRFDKKKKKKKVCSLLVRFLL